MAVDVTEVVETLVELLLGKLVISIHTYTQTLLTVQLNSPQSHIDERKQGIKQQRSSNLKTFTEVKPQM